MKVDAAVAQPISSNLIEPGIIGIGLIRGTATALVGQSVQKSGRSTGFTRGRITVVGTTVNVGFSGRSARFTNQIVSSKMGEPGDSGSLLLDSANRAIGLLFAGGPKATIYNPIGDVLQALQIRLTPEPGENTIISPEGYRSLRELCESSAETILKLPNVVGIGIGHKLKQHEETGETCLTVLVSKKLRREDLQAEELVPATLGGVATDVIESGLLTADTRGTWYGTRQNRKERLRPARPGMSIGHYRVSSGTFGAVVYDEETGEPLILSNNHVLANATNGRDGLARIGDPILQPGHSDGGQNPQDLIAKLHRIYPLHF